MQIHVHKTMEEALDSKERDGANLKKKIINKNQDIDAFCRTKLLIRSYCLRVVNYLVVKSCYLSS